MWKSIYQLGLMVLPPWGRLVPTHRAPLEWLRIRNVQLIRPSQEVQNRPDPCDEKRNQCQEEQARVGCELVPQYVIRCPGCERLS